MRIYSSELLTGRPGLAFSTETAAPVGSNWGGELSAVISRRDYSLVGPRGQSAEEAGLASAAMVRLPDPAQAAEGTHEAQGRAGAPRHRDLVRGLDRLRRPRLSISGARWAAVPFFLIYGVLYGSSSDSRWHECGHGTAFKTRWMNDVVYHIACFMIMREPTVWRWSHTRHHTDTIIVGRDPEIAVMRPADIARLLS